MSAAVVGVAVLAVALLGPRAGEAPSRTPVSVVNQTKTQATAVAIAPESSTGGTVQAGAPAAEEDEKVVEPGPTARSPEVATLQSSRAVDVDPRQFRQLLPRDAIAPICDPSFLPAADAGLEAEELVIGVEINGESRTYPIGPLAPRQMDNDVVAGVPILVTR